MARRFPVYSRLLKLYPRPYRDQYGPQILQTLDDMLDDSQNSKLLVWAKTLMDYPLNVTKQNIMYAGGIMAHQTPGYVKRNSAVAGALILPFFALVAINGLSHHTLDFSNGWKKLLVILLVGLPSVAFILCAATFIKWSRTRQSFWKSLFDLRHNWLILVPGFLALLIALFIPFHDSTHCVSGNPIKELRNFHDSVSCIQHG